MSECLIFCLGAKRSSVFCLLGDPGSEFREIVVGPWDDLDGSDRAKVGGGGGGGIEAGFDRSNVAGEKAGDETGADLIPARHFDVGGFEGGVRGFDEGDETLGFDDADCLFGQGGVELEGAGC